MYKDILISIIVPIYNVEKYLCKCIDSLINQSEKRIEIILVDDGSSDNCGAICDSYEKKDNRIKVIHKENGGLSSARNAGLDIAKGEYIGFVDSDDWIEIDMYKILFDFAIKYDADIVYSNFKKVYSENEVHNIVDSNKVYVFERNEALNNIYTELGIHTVVSWNKLYKRSLFNKIRFPDGHIHEDVYTTHKLLNISNKVVYIDKTLYYYRQNESSITNSSFSEKNLDYLYALHERLDFAKNIENKIFYNNTIQRYCLCLKGYYLKCNKNVNNFITLKKIIKKMSQNIYRKYILNKEIPIVDKLKFTFFVIFPEIYFCIGNKKNS